MKRYYANGKGWFGDSKRKSLAARGISAGRKVRRSPAKYSIADLNDFRQQESFSGTTEFQETEPSELPSNVTDELDNSVEEIAAQSVDTQPDAIREVPIQPISAVEAQKPIGILPAVRDVLPVTSTLNQDLGHEL